jgi:hypothetical protein
VPSRLLECVKRDYGLLFVAHPNKNREHVVNLFDHCSVGLQSLPIFQLGFDQILKELLLVRGFVRYGPVVFLQWFVFSELRKITVCEPTFEGVPYRRAIVHTHDDFDVLMMPASSPRRPADRRPIDLWAVKDVMRRPRSVVVWTTPATRRVRHNDELRLYLVATQPSSNATRGAFSKDFLRNMTQ